LPCFLGLVMRGKEQIEEELGKDSERFCGGVGYMWSKQW